MLARIAAPATAVRAHEELFAYWASLRREGRLPGRRDLDPGCFKPHLPTITLIDVRRTPLDFRIRLAGTALYDLYGREITGLDCAGAYASDASYWRDSLTAVVEQAKPRAGMRPVPAGEARGLSVMWLRLPLASDGRTVDMILGYDAVIGDINAQPTGIRAA